MGQGQDGPPAPKIKPVVENDVLMLEHDNKPGTISRIAKKLAAAKITVSLKISRTKALMRFSGSS
jgi:hypothetical protein